MHKSILLAAILTLTLGCQEHELKIQGELKGAVEIKTEGSWSDGFVVSSFSKQAQLEDKKSYQVEYRPGVLWQKDQLKISSQGNQELVVWINLPRKNFDEDGLVFFQAQEMGQDFDLKIARIIENEKTKQVKKFFSCKIEGCTTNPHYNSAQMSCSGRKEVVQQQLWAKVRYQLTFLEVGGQSQLASFSGQTPSTVMINQETISEGACVPILNRRK